jgi:hypothetical protein
MNHIHSIQYEFIFTEAGKDLSLDPAFILCSAVLSQGCQTFYDKEPEELLWPGSWDTCEEKGTDSST